MRSKPNVRVDPQDYQRILDFADPKGLDNNDVVAVALDAFERLEQDQREDLIERRRRIKRARDGRRFNCRRDLSNHKESQ
jgi:hypothetical protein